VNITVVGAGVVGCAIAYELASRGADVTLLDGRGPSLGATRASAGILAPYLEGHIPALRKLAACSLSMYDDFIRRVERDSGRRIEYERHGTLQVALSDSDAQQLSADALALRHEGVDHMLLDPAGTQRLEPELAERATAGLLVPSHGYVCASSLTHALVAAAEAHGVRVATDMAIRIEGGQKSAVVTTKTDVLQADAVILASGCWPIESRPSPAPSIRPIRGQLVQLHLDEPVASRVIWGRECYLVPWRDGSVLVGATSEDVGFDERPTADGIRGLLNAAADLLPALGRARFQEVRVGLRPKGFDDLPIIGRSMTAPSVHYALGHYRNGVLLAPVTAALVADLVIDGRERDELALVRPDRRSEG
jgi:glycine oxidase